MKNILNAIKSVFRGFDNKLNQIAKSIPDKLSDLENDLFYSNITEQLHLTLSDLIEHDDGTGMFTYGYNTEQGFDYLEDPSKFKVTLSFSCNGESHSYTQDDLNYYNSGAGYYTLDNYCYVEFTSFDKYISVWTFYHEKLESFDLRIYSGEEKVIPSNVVEKMSGASATEDGKAGVVPAPKAGQQDFALFGDGKYRLLSTIQPDYTQNDETASDYIKNRPFGYYTIQDIVLEEIPFTYQNTKEQTSIRLTESELLESGSSIDVLTVVDEAFGERYDLPKRTIPEYVIDEHSCIGFGNVSLASSSSSDTGEKFLVGLADPYVDVYRVVDESRVGTESSLTCLVSKPVGKKVDPDFLPMANSLKLGCGKATVIDDSDTATKRNTKPIYIDSDGILYSGLTLPTSGSIGDIPVIKYIYYGDQYIYGRTTLGGFLNGVSSNNYYHFVSLDSPIRDIVFILTDAVSDLCLSVGDKDIVEIGSVGANCKIHVQSIIRGYLSVNIYDGEIEKEYNFLSYELTYVGNYNLLKLYSSGQTSFTCTTYYNKIV